MKILLLCIIQILRGRLRYYAIVTTRTKKKSYFILKPEQVEVYVYRWVIVGAKGEILDLEPLKRNHGLDIQPDNHEVGFIDLSKIAAIGNENILNYSERIIYRMLCLSFML